MFKYIFGVDLGYSKDYAGIAGLERCEMFREKTALPNTPEWHREKKTIVSRYDLRFLERPPLGTKYSIIVDRLEAISNNPDLARRIVIVVDATGVGLPVVQMMRDVKLNIVPVVITSGSSPASMTEDGFYHVTKREIIVSLQVAVECHRLKIAKGLELGEVFRKELQNFRMKITAKGNDTYEAWREKDHDDLVISVALPVWYAGKLYGNDTARDDRMGRKKKEYDPLNY